MYKLILFILVLAAASLFSIPATSEDLMSVGFGAFKSAENSFTETKFIRLAHRDSLDSVSFYQLEGGIWIDGAGGGRLSSAFAALSLGMNVDLRPVFIVNSLGLAVITTPDAYLGGSFPQFTEELGIGIRGINATSVSLSYKHFSSAGIYNPNMGRDFFVLNMGVGL